MPSNSVPLGILEIKKLLPQRYPLLMVDRVLEVIEAKPGQIVGRICRAVKNVTVNENFFEGHFPNQPIMPGIFILEAIAQTGALCCSAVPGDRKIEQLYLAGLNNVKFKKPVVPGDILHLQVEMQKNRSSFYWGISKASVNGETVASADILAHITFKKSVN